MIDVWKRQKRNWKIIAIRQVFNRFFNEIVRSYSNIYITLLGASPVDLGIVNSFTGISNALISVPLGWFQDRYSIRKIFIMGIGLLAIVPIIYATASSWQIIIPAMVLAALARKEGSCLIICNISLDNEDRLTAKSICEGIGRIPALLAPVTAAYIISVSGGMNVNGLRPIFWIQFIASFILFLFILTQLKEIERPQLHRGYDKESEGFFNSFRDIFRKGVKLKRWVLFSSISSFLMMMMRAFRYNYAFEIKHADQYMIGLLATASVLLQIFMYTPIGKLSDKIGRKKILYILIPLVWISNLLYVFSPSNEILLIAAFLNGFQLISMVVQNAMTAELIPPEYMGRWIGLLGLFIGLIDIPAPIIGGLIWENIGPEFIFIIPIIIDILIRLPLLYTMPETVMRARQS